MYNTTEHIATIYTNEPIRDLDVLEKNSDGLWQVERNVISYNATEFTWEQYENHPLYITRNINNISLITHFINSDNSAITNNNTALNFLLDGQCSKRYGTEDRVYFKNEKISSLEEWNAWIVEENVIIHSKLATPTYEILDTQSQLALNALKTFNGITRIKIDSRVQPEETMWEFGTSQVGAYALKSLNDNDTDRIERAEMKAELEELRVAMLAMGSEV